MAITVNIYYTGEGSNARKFAEEAKEEFPGVDFIIEPLSLSVACHIGPESVAMAITKKLESE